MTIKRFIRKTPIKSLRRYFEHLDADVANQIDWEAGEAEIIRSAFQVVEEMDEPTSARLRSETERLNGMADEAGQTALYSVIGDRSSLDGLANGHERALWLFLDQQALFRRAEEVRYTDERRRGRNWDGFVGAPGLDLKRDDAAMDAFKAALRERFASQNIHIDVFERVRPSFDGADSNLVQLTIYREGLADQEFAFEEGELVQRAHHPVIEAAMTYETATGVIEVVSKDRETREELVRLMARALLDHEFQGEKVALKIYDLSPLLRRFAFPTDSADGIESVEVKQLRLMPIDDASERVTLECLRKASRDIWSMAAGRFGASDPLAGGWVATQARLTIKFQPRGDARRGRTLPLTITMPNGCNLKEQTEDEQLIGDRYLRRWGILRDI